MECIIVLGNSDAAVSLLRVSRAIEYYNKRKSSKEEEQERLIIVFSGKGSSFPGSSEGEWMREQAISKFGLPPSVCLMETQSTNTHENLAFTKALLQSNAKNSLFHLLLPLPPPPPPSPPFSLTSLSPGHFQDRFEDIKHFTICTSSFHIKRSLVIGLLVFGPKGNLQLPGSPSSSSASIHSTYTSSTSPLTLPTPFLHLISPFPFLTTVVQVIHTNEDPPPASRIARERDLVDDYLSWGIKFFSPSSEREQGTQPADYVG
jgi:hypothetical protein